MRVNNVDHMTVMSTKHTIQRQLCYESYLAYTKHAAIQQLVTKFAVSTCVIVEFKKSTEAVLTGIKMSSCCVVTVQ